MLLAHALLRNELGNYTLLTLGQSKIYVKVLQLLNDNTDGKLGAFSI